VVKFYERRARRILPALFLVMAVSAVLAWLFLLPGDRRDFSESLAAVAVFSSNVLFWFESGYFDTAAEFKPLLHTWSLAVEEQYYLFFPVLLLFGHRLGRVATIWSLLAIGLLSFGIALWGAGHASSATFFLLPARIWELLIGSLIALLGLGDAQRWLPSRSVANLGAIVGLGLLGLAVFGLEKTTPFPSVYTLLPTIGTALIIVFARQDTIAGRVLSWTPLVGIGLISYSAYLWHQPLFAFARHNSLEEISASLATVLLGVTFVLAYLSWRFVEQPFRDRKRVSSRTVLRFAVISSAAFVVAGSAGSLSRGFEEEYYDDLDARSRELMERNRPGAEDSVAFYDDGECRFHSEVIDASLIARFERCAAKHGRAVIVTGGSHASDLYQAMARVAGRPFFVGISRGGCRPYMPNPECHYDELLPFVADHVRQIDRVVYTADGFYLLQDEHGAPGSRSLFRMQQIPVYRPHETYIARTIDYLSQLQTHVPVLFMGPRLEHHKNVMLLAKFAIKCEGFDVQLDPNIRKTFEGLDGYLAQRAAAAKIEYFSSMEAIHFDARTDLYDCGAVYWTDGDHWSEDGERLFGLRLVQALRAKGMTDIVARSQGFRPRG
jgi:peptidoglycan/LPS O-acetylase OafA/YrhL